MKHNIVWMSLIGIALVACSPKQDNNQSEVGVMDTLLLRDFHPQNVNNIPQTFVEKARYGVIDMHSHDYAESPEDIAHWVKTMEACNIRETHVMHCSWIGAPFEDVVARYSAYPDKFRFWCCFDYTQMLQDGSADEAIAYLEHCHALGAVGVGEMGDKGEGDLYARPAEGRGIHLDDPRLQPVLKRCGELGMPISIHIAEPYWMYLPQDGTNDGLPNGAVWHVDTSAETCLDYDGLMTSFENAVRNNPNTTFIACHYLNMNQDLPRLGALLDKYPNMYIDIAARVAEAAQTPRATRAFLIKYQDRILFGTDNGMSADMYRNIFRVYETEDEHFYIPDFNYHWALSGMYLPDSVLKKLYYENAEKVLGR